MEELFSNEMIFSTFLQSGNIENAKLYYDKISNKNRNKFYVDILNYSNFENNNYNNNISSNLMINSLISNDFKNFLNNNFNIFLESILFDNQNEKSIISFLDNISNDNLNGIHDSNSVVLNTILCPNVLKKKRLIKHYFYPKTNNNVFDNIDLTYTNSDGVNVFTLYDSLNIVSTEGQILKKLNKMFQFKNSENHRCLFDINYFIKNKEDPSKISDKNIAEKSLDIDMNDIEYFLSRINFKLYDKFNCSFHSIPNLVFSNQQDIFTEIHLKQLEKRL